MQEEKNILAQPNKFKWRDNPPKVTPREMRIAMETGREAHKFECIVGIQNVQTLVIAGSALCMK